MDNEIVKKALEILRELESGECIRMPELIKGTNLCDEAFMKDEMAMMDISMKIIAAAKKERIYLESIFGDDAIVGLPSNITYAIKRKYDPEKLSKDNCIGISYKAGGYLCCVPAISAEVYKENTGAAQWDGLMDAIFDRCKVQNWYDTYIDHCILDGYYWDLEIKLSDGVVLKYGGSNKEPRSLKMLERALKPWAKEDYLGISCDEDAEEGEKEMKKKITEVVFILDASGSMYDLTEDTIGGFNSMLAEQKKKDGEVLISTVTFNTESKVVHDRIDIKEVPDMTKTDYVAGGGTALIDAMGDAIHHISSVHKYIRKEDVPEKTLFIITTDGMENSSHRHTSDEVKKMVEAKKELGWDFIFMGANIDAVETAASYGIARDMAVNFKSDRIGTAKNYKAFSKLMDMAVCESRIDPSWKDEVEEDMKNRK